jgi:predicted metal-dependent hydrolase
MYNGDTIATPAGWCTLRRSDRRTLAISVLPDGAVELIAPHDARPEAIAAKVGKRLRWIVTQQRNFAEMNKARVPRSYASGATHRYLGRQYRLKVRQGSAPGVKLVGAYFNVTVAAVTTAAVQKELATWFKAKAIDQFSRRVAIWKPWCRDRNLPEPSLRLLRMPKRWGSSHRNGRIYLNPDLVKVPSICIDYVVAHEVCHLKHPHHDKAFFRLLDQTFPSWKSVKSRLEVAEV